MVALAGKAACCDAAYKTQSRPEADLVGMHTATLAVHNTRHPSTNESNGAGAPVVSPSPLPPSSLQPSEL